MGASSARQSEKWPIRTSAIASVYIRVSVENRMANGDTAVIKAAEVPAVSASTLVRVPMDRPHEYANGIIRTPSTPGSARAATSPSPNNRIQKCSAA